LWTPRNPADQRCLAGELLAVQPSATDWALKEEIVELERR
jgi:hypothetical protein